MWGADWNSVTRVTFRHHEACRVMPNSYPCGGIFNPHNIDSFSCILFLRRLYLSLNIFKAKICTFSIKKCSVRLLTSSYTPSYKTEISRTGKNRVKPCLVCKKIYSGIQGSNRRRFRLLSLATDEYILLFDEFAFNITHILFFSRLY